jgi:hypothetical protein
MIYFSVHGINLIITCDDNILSKFITESLGYFLLNAEASIYNYKIEVIISFENHVNIDEQTKRLNKIGNGAYLKDNLYVCVFDKYLLKIEKHENKLQVSVFKVKYTSIYLNARKSLKYLIRGEDYFSLLRQIIIFPVFWALARFSGIYTMHSGSINLTGYGVAFAGLAGVGKSTSSLALTLKHNGLFLSDNYTLYDKNNFYPFPEWIRISNNTKILLGDSLEQLGKKHFTRYGRDYYLLNEKYISSPVSPAVLIVQMLGKEYEINEISTNASIDRILLSNAHVKEFYEHTTVGLIDFMYQFDVSLYETLVGDLRNLLTNTFTYEMVVEKDANISDVYHHIINETKLVDYFKGAS